MRTDPIGYHFRSYSPGDHKTSFHDNIRGYASNLLAGFDPARGAIDSGKLARLEQGLASAAKNGTKARLFFSPAHIVRLDLYHQLGVMPHFEVLRREMLAMVQRINEAHPGSVTLWDFTSCAFPHNEPVPDDPTAHMRWYYELSHYTPLHGEQVMAKLFPEIDFGIEKLAGFGSDLTQLPGPAAIVPVDVEQCRSALSEQISEAIIATQATRCKANPAWCEATYNLYGRFSDHPLARRPTASRGAESMPPLRQSLSGEGVR